MSPSIPDFSNFKYLVATPPTASKLSAWQKLQECERRLEFYQWCEKLNDPGRAEHRILLNDSVSAFLLTMEATIQFLENQFSKTHGASAFWPWIKKQRDFDFRLRGLRALRHFESHVEPKQSTRVVTLSVILSCTWYLPSLNTREVAKLKTKPIKPGQLSHWNRFVRSTPAPDVFKICLERLKRILMIAESIV